MNRGLTFFSRATVYFIVLSILAICVVLLPELAREATVENPSNSGLNNLFVLLAYITVLPIFVALYHTDKLLRNLNTDQAFSDKTIARLNGIKLCTAVFSCLVVINVVIGSILIRIDSSSEDITHIIVLGSIFVLAASVIGVFAAVLQKLLAQAIDIQRDNELIV